MKNISKDHLARLREALSAAHHEKEKIQVGDTWRVRTMGHIMDLGPLYFKAGYFTLFNRFLWKLAPVTCGLAVALIVTLSRMDFFSGYELARLFINRPADFILLAMNYG